ncbi:MAG: pyridoxal phosphate-dependent aminotransferase [Candidatus Omnitrophota bacterium]|nr:pyridoxal phosphate-dependent aminotransferase [Candidatus Omnitrophota bacterium]
MITPRVSSLSESTTLKITSLTKKLKKEGKDVVDFAAGEPDFDTPIFIKEEAKKAIDLGITKYTPSSGILELKEAIANKLRQDNKIPCESKNIIVTTGAKYAIFAAIFALSDSGDEVLLPSPYWVSYPEIVKLAGASLKSIPTVKKNNFKLQPRDLKKAITSKTKLLILNYPNNPTGITYSVEELKEIYEVIMEKKIMVLSDEIYEMLLYDGKIHKSFASFPNAHDFTVTINGFSKSFSMTGWRLGYLEAPDAIANGISKIIDHTTSCASSISQMAALAAFKNNNWSKQMNKEFEKRRDLLWQGLSTCDKLEPIKSEGTFYMLCDIRKAGLSSLEFSSQLLEKQLVSTIPADAFDAEGFIRLSFATSTQDIIKGIERIKLFLKEL